MKTLKTRLGLIGGVVAVVATLTLARAAERWEPVAGGVPGWVLDTLAVTFEHAADGTRARFSVTIPNPCHRLTFGEPLRDGRQVIVPCGLEVLLGLACPQVLSTQTGQLDLGPVEPGAGELVIRADGGGLVRFPFDVPARAPGATPEALPVISAVLVEEREVIVTVEAPAGVRRVTLEGRSRLGAGAWVPRAVERLPGSGGTVTFRIAKSETVEMLRVRGDATEALPSRHYEGRSEFQGEAIAGTAANPPADAWRNFDGIAAPEAGGGGSRPVVESDIWVVRGDRLYFFNQYRGLQVVDLTQPDRPVLSGALQIPAAGEQMYLLGDQHAVLLARAGCDGSADPGSQALIVNVAGGAPVIVKSLPVPGYIQESRLVGSALYVASQTYRVVPLPPGRPGQPPGQQWEYGTTVTAFDLSDPTAPVARDSLWFPGYGNVVAATDRFLFIGLQVPTDWWQSEVRLLDISSPDGVMKPTATVRPAGRVDDKFKLNLDGDVFTVISHVWRWEDRDETASVLETFSLADPAAPRKLGQIRVGEGEALFATRFDGDRAYIVTFERIDPLWIVDLRDPTQPRLHGELEVPGWSTYIQPLGDRLVTVGVGGTNNTQVEVSLFDVRDPAKPALLSKVPLGENHSWSEANYDEKAFTVLPEAGLILVPYQGYAPGGHTSRVQLIDLAEDTLQARGVIEHAMQARRATLRGDRILSLSGRELLTVNAADRDRPQVTSNLELAWPVDDVFAVGNHLVLIERGSAWWGGNTPGARVVSATDPNRLLGKLALPLALPITASTRIGDFLYVAQFDPAVAGVEAGKEGEPPPPPNLYLTVIELAALPELRVAGTTATRVEAAGWLGNLKAFVPRPELLVLTGGASGWWRGPWGVDFLPGGRWLPWWWSGAAGGQFFAFDVTDPRAPRFASFTQLSTDNTAWGFGPTFLVNGLFYLSHQRSEFVPDAQAQPPRVPDLTRGRWVTRHFLSVVDFADPANPTLRPPVNLPGQLAAVTHAGEVLYTTGYHWNEKGETDWTQFLDVLAYDGVEASLVTSQRIGDGWTGQLATVADHLILGRHDSAKPSTRLETWRLSEQGVLLQVGLTETPGYLAQLTRLEELLLASAGSAVTVWDTTQPTNLRQVGQGTGDGCVYPSLDNGLARQGTTLWLPQGDYGVVELKLTP